MSATTVTPARINPDSPTLVRSVVTAVGVLASASFVAGVPGLLHVASWAQLPSTLRWVVPLLLDGALLIYGAVVVVQRARQERARFAWAVLTSLTAASVAAQVAHVMDTVGGAGWQTTAGAALAGSFPLLVFASTHTVLGLAVAPTPTRKRRAAAQTSTPRTAAPAPKADAVPPVRSVTQEGPNPPVRAVGGAVRDRAVEMARSGMSQRAIAQALGVSKSSVGRWLEAASLAA